MTIPFCLQIHEFYEEFEEARSVLRAYRAKNPDNPNAHRLLYEHLQRHWEQCGDGSVQEEIVSCLKVSGAGVNYPAGRSWLILTVELMQHVWAVAVPR